MRSLKALRALVLIFAGACASACGSTTVIREVVEARAVNSPTIYPGQPAIVQSLPGYKTECASVIQSQQVLTNTGESREEKQIMPDSAICQPVIKPVRDAIERRAQQEGQTSGGASGGLQGNLGGAGVIPIPPAVSRKLAQASNTCMTFSAGETGFPYDTDWCKGLGLNAPIYPKVSVRPPVPLGGVGGYPPYAYGGGLGFYSRPFGGFPLGYPGYGSGTFFSGRF